MRSPARHIPLPADCVHYDGYQCKACAAWDLSWMNLGMLQKQKVNLSKRSGLYRKVKLATMAKRFLRDPERWLDGEGFV
jgi:hypothetical protein